MTLFHYDEDEEECFTCYSIFYGKNAKIKSKPNGYGGETLYPVATAPHSVVIKIELSSDNYETIYFSDKSDYLQFKSTVRDTLYEVTYHDKTENGYYSIAFHMG